MSDQHTAESDGIRAAVERSSLGTAEAVAARRSVSDETAARIVARADRLTRIRAVIAEHAEHVGAGGGKFWAECLAVGCGWTEHGEGSLMDGLDAHRDHLTSEIERAVFPPASTDGGA